MPQETFDQDRGSEIQKILADFLQSRPNASYKELWDSFKQINLTALERKVIARTYYSLIEQNVETRTITRRVFRDAQALWEDSPIQPTQKQLNETAGEILFEIITEEKPGGKVTLLVEKWAVGLVVHDSLDLERIGLDALGFADRHHFNSAHARGKNAQIDAFPYFVSLNNSGEIVDHEVFHHVLDAIRHAMMGVSPRFKARRWGGLPITADNEQLAEYGWSNKILRLIRLYEQDLIDFTSLDERIIKLAEKYLPMALSEAKEEVLADFTATRTFKHLDNVMFLLPNDYASFNLEDHLAEPYLFWDAFFSSKLIKKNPELYSIYKKILEEYSYTLQTNVVTAENIWNAMLRQDPNADTSELMRYLLQNPIETWSESLEHNLLFAKVENEYIAILLEKQKIEDNRQRFESLRVQLDRQLAELDSLEDVLFSDEQLTQTGVDGVHRAMQIEVVEQRDVVWNLYSTPFFDGSDDWDIVQAEHTVQLAVKVIAETNEVVRRIKRYITTLSGKTHAV